MQGTISISPPCFCSTHHALIEVKLLSTDDRKPKRGQLAKAIEHLESQRATSGDAVVDAALSPLRQELAHIEERLSTVISPGERRIVTILFSDVTGSTTIAEGLDPEECGGPVSSVLLANYVHISCPESSRVCEQRAYVTSSPMPSIIRDLPC